MLLAFILCSKSLSYISRLLDFTTTLFTFYNSNTLYTYEWIHINTKGLSIFHFYFTGILLFIFPDCEIRRIFCLFTHFDTGWKCVRAFLYFQMRQKDTLSTRCNVWMSSSLESTAVLFCVQSWHLLAPRSTGSWESSTRSHLPSSARSRRFWYWPKTAVCDCEGPSRKGISGSDQWQNEVTPSPHPSKRTQVCASQHRDRSTLPLGMKENKIHFYQYDEPIIESEHDLVWNHESEFYVNRWHLDPPILTPKSLFFLFYS